MLNQDTVFELVEPGIFVGMKSPPNAVESFFVAEVMDKGIAENNRIDENGHTIMSGELCLEVCSLQKEAQKKSLCDTNIPRSYTEFLFMQLKYSLYANIALDAALCMDINECQSILSTAI